MAFIFFKKLLIIVYSAVKITNLTRFANGLWNALRLKLYAWNPRFQKEIIKKNFLIITTENSHFTKKEKHLWWGPVPQEQPFKSCECFQVQKLSWNFIRTITEEHMKKIIDRICLVPALVCTTFSGHLYQTAVILKPPLTIELRMIQLEILWRSREFITDIRLFKYRKQIFSKIYTFFGVLFTVLKLFKINWHEVVRSGVSLMFIIHFCFFVKQHKQEI